MDENKKEVFVIGHKNPDTDSICSAIAYAYYKNQQHNAKYNYIPKRAGQISMETSFVLDHFNAEPPTYTNDVRSQVKDAVLNEGERVDKSMSVQNAWKILTEKHQATLAVVKKDGTLDGLITIGDIAKSYMDVYGSTILSEAKTPYKNIMQTLQGELLTGDIKKKVTKGKVLIAAANPDLMEEYIEEGDIVILGDRYESQLCAIEMQAGCLIVCVNAEVSDSILNLAKERGCTVIRTGYDTFITARLLNQSVPIDFFMVREGLITFKTEDYIEDIRSVMAKKRHRDFPVLDENDKFAGMITRHSLIDMDKKRVILVDHNERSQAVDGIEDAQILEIIDHHKLGYVETIKPVTFRNQPLGCTSTIVYLLYKETNTPIPANIAGLMCSAIISDTLLYRSPTCTPLDKIAAGELAKIADIEVESYAKAMFTAGSNLKAKSESEIFFQDFKKFTAGKHLFGVGQISSMDMDELQGIKGDLAKYMEETRDSLNVGMIFFMLTDILTESTDLICVGGNAASIAAETFKTQVEPDGGSVYLQGVVSRKKQLIPKLMRAFQ